MALEMRSMATGPDAGLERQTPKRQSWIKAALAQKKRQSRGNPILRPDPFRFGNPNPLGCHPYFSEKHPDYIHSPQTSPRPISFPVFNTTPGSSRLSAYNQDDLDAYRSHGFVPRPIRPESLDAILEFFNSNTLSRAMENSVQPARRPPPIPSTPQKSSTAPQAQQRRLSEVSPLRAHKVAAVQSGEDRGINHRKNNHALPTPPPTPPKDKPLARLTRHPATTIDKKEGPILPSPTSGLPQGWNDTHDRLIAYLDTHARLTNTGEMYAREAKKPRYSVEEMISLLRARFVIFRDIPIPTWAVTRRLGILDQQDNTYFDVPYCGYKSETWGKGI